jgi:hypothetical protein
MNKPGERDCKITDGGIWLSESIIKVMASIYDGKACPPQTVKPLCYYEGKRDLLYDLLSFIQEEGK